MIKFVFSQNQVHIFQKSRQTDIFYWREQNQALQYQNQLKMETHRRKRGISLTHNTSKVKQEYIQQPNNPATTRIHYVRYPISNTNPRSTSTPKPRINFNYTTVHSGYFNQSSLNSSSYIVETNPIIHTQEIYDYKPYVRPTQTFILSTPQVTIPKETEVITQKYENFQQCKELIGKRLFGNNPSNNKSKCPGAVRINSFVRPSKIEEFNLYLQQSKQNAKPEERALQESFKINIIPSQKHQQKVKTFDALKISNNVEIKVECRSQKVKARRKDSKKLQQMQRKLQQIIKICDQNA